MAARIRETDWAGHPLGPPEDWPQALKLAIDLCLGSSFPMAVYWGPDLRLLYNDAWAPIPAERHPWALGRPAAEVWSDIWSIVGPEFARALAGEGIATYDQMLPMVRGGKPRETWWNYSISPIRDEGGAICGVFNQGNETTRTVLAERQLAEEAERLRQSEARLQLALEASTAIGTWDWDILGDKVTADARFARLYGVDPALAAAGIPIAHFLETIHPDDIDRVGQEIDHCLTTGGAFSSEYRLVQADGREIWIAAQGRAMLDAEGRAIQFPGVAFDITERKATEARLRATARGLRAANEAQTFLFNLAADLRETEGVDAVMRLAAQRIAEQMRADRGGFFRVLEGDVIQFGVGWSNGALPVLQGSMPAGAFEKVRRDDDEHVQTVIITNSDVDTPAAARDVAVARSGVGVPLMRGGEWVAGFHMGQTAPRDWTAEEISLIEAAAQTAWDAVQRSETLSALRESEGKFRAIANSIDQMVWSTRPDGFHDYYNDRWYEYTGVPYGSTDGEGWSEMFHPDDQERAWATWRHSLETGARYRIEYRLRHRSGDYRWVLGSAQPIRDEDGRITRWFGTCTDIEEIVAAREVLARSRLDLENAVVERTRELMVAEEALRQAQKMEAVGQLTGGIAHDFNNMLAVVIGAIDLMQRRVAQGRTDIDRYLEAARDGANRAAALTQRLLSFARQAPIAPVPVDCNALIAGMTELLSRTIGETIRIETALDPDLWHAIADPSQLENAILNLSVNARDAMPQGGTLTISTANETVVADDAEGSSAPAGDFVRLCVTDTGLGMSEDVAARAFDPFFTTKAVGKGTGLGLSQVFGFVGQLGGHVSLETAEGKGTTVCLRLPRLTGEATPRPTESTTEPLPQGSRSESILVVEDEDRVRSYSVEALRELGYTVTHARDGAEALALIQAGRAFDLLFTDVVMPGLNGAELARGARAHLPELRLLFTSGYTGGTDLGATGLDAALLPKPFDVAALARAIRAALDAPHRA